MSYRNTKLGLTIERLAEIATRFFFGKPIAPAVTVDQSRFHRDCFFYGIAKALDVIRNRIANCDDLSDVIETVKIELAPEAR